LNGIYALAVAYILSQFYRTFLAVLTPVLTADLGMTKADFALASGLWFFAFAAMQFIIGVGLDRIGPKRTTFWILAPFGTIGGLLFATAQSPIMIIFGMALIGIGMSPVLMAAVFLFAKRYEPARFASLSSVFIGIGVGGAVLGASPLAWAATTFGWRSVMATLALLTFLVSIWLYATVKDPHVETAASNSGFAGYLDLLKLKTLWPLMPIVFFSYAVMIGIRGLWAGPFLTVMQGADAKLIGNITLSMSLAMVVATLSVGTLTTIFKSEKRVALALNSIVVLACAALAFNPAMPLWQATLCLVCITLFGSGFVAQAAHGRRFYPSHLMGRGVTLLNAISIGGAGILQFFTGALVTATANPGAPGLQFSWLFGFYAIGLGFACCIYMCSKDALSKL
jgi:predicted MFS family arabinose efflux permease